MVGMGFMFLLLPVMVVLAGMILCMPGAVRLAGVGLLVMGLMFFMMGKRPHTMRDMPVPPAAEELAPGN